VSSGCAVVVIAHNIRSMMNVGAILRTCEGFGVATVLATGYTPNLEVMTDGSQAKLLPHIRQKLARELHKTALGAEEVVDFRFSPNVMELIEKLRAQDFRIVGLEQDARAIPLPNYSHKLRSCRTRSCKSPTLAGSDPAKEESAKIALILGEEVHGLTPSLRDACDDLVEIPMFGQKESFNVSVATGIVLYHLIATQSAP